MKPLLSPPIASVLKAVLEVAQRGVPFSSDEVREHLDGLHVKVNSAAIGNGIRECMMHGWIVRVGERTSRRKSNHGRRVDLWQQGTAELAEVQRAVVDVVWQHYFCERCSLTISEPRVTHTADGNVCPSCGGPVTAV